MRTPYIFGLLLAFFLNHFTLTTAQDIYYNTAHGISVEGLNTAKGNNISILNIPMFSFLLNEEEVSSSNAKVSMMPENTLLMFDHGVMAKFSKTGDMSATIEFINKGKDTVTLENAVPFGTDPAHTYITSSGPWSLTRAKLFRPGNGAVGVILPDNAWELGYGSFPINDTLSLCGLCRRMDTEKAQKHRCKTLVYPGGTLVYEFHFELFSGPWQNGIIKMFQENLLYDLDTFDNKLFEREDLQWVRHAYVAGLNFAWDNEFYDRDKREYTLQDYLDEGDTYFGGYDIYALWPTWPRLGLDERNQWDLFRDLPGGLTGIRELVDSLHGNDTRFFICFNPWDGSTRKEDPYKGIAAVIEATDADGVVLDCRGKSNERLQKIADSIKPGVIMYSEGMAIVKDMPGIVAGRVHNAIYYSPPLNLNKLIKPEFAIFRVCEPRDKDLKREFAIAFFNGYGTELNSMGPGRPAAGINDLIFLGKTSMILRQNSDNFLSPDWTPLYPSLKDSIWVNEWPGDNKTIYSILSFVPEGHNGPLFESRQEDDFHYVSLWQHEEIETVSINGKQYLPATLESFNAYERNTRKEGSVDCIAAFPDHLYINDEGSQLLISARKGDKIRVWRSDVSYQNAYKDYEPEVAPVIVDGSWLAGEAKIIVQLFDNEELIDERVIKSESGKAWLVSKTIKTQHNTDRKGMVFIPGGEFSFRTSQNDQFIPYPGPKEAVNIILDSFYMDTYPVSNKQFKTFLEHSGYVPEDTSNFLKHWRKGRYPKDLADHPVVFICYEDAQAYAAWAGKRLPTEAEWQYAAPFGVMKMLGNVWQMTNDKYDNGSHSFIIIKGGSYFKPESSWWYIQGGQQTPERQQMLLLVSPGFDRASTVGFRCVQDPKF